MLEVTMSIAAYNCVVGAVKHSPPLCSAPGHCLLPDWMLQRHRGRHLPLLQSGLQRRFQQQQLASQQQEQHLRQACRGTVPHQGPRSL